MSRMSIVRNGIVAVIVLICGAMAALAADRPIKVLLCTGDWKSQPYYQNVIMAKDGKPAILRGRFISQEVEKAAPGKFEFTDIPNYIGQEYLDPDYLSQFDVVLLGDIMAHFPLAWQQAVNEYVKNGGGLIYCANHKWGTGAKHHGQPFEDCLPTTWPAPDEKGHFSWQTGDVNFQLAVTAPAHAAIEGLDWASAPPLSYAFNMPARKEATVLLASLPVTTRTWLVSPTYPVAKPEPGKPAANIPLPDTKDQSKWKQVSNTRSGQMDLISNVGQMDWVGVWAQIAVKSPADRKVTIVANGDDSAIVYLNGARVQNKDGKPSNNTNGEADLKAGWNTILVRCDQYGGGWSFNFDIRDDRGKSLADLAYAPHPKDGFKPVVLPGNPMLAAWDYGKGRAMTSATIFSNDESSERFGAEWKDFGKYYAQVFAWLGDHSQNNKASLKDAAAEVNVTIDFNRPLNTISPALFSIHGNEGIDGEALTNYMALNPKGAFYRSGVGVEGDAPDGADVNSFNWDAMKKDMDGLDARLAEAKRYGCEMIGGFHGLTYNKPDWLWQSNWWGKCNEKQAAEVAKMFAAVIEHANKGKGTDKTYQLNLKYVELGNEPDLNEDCIDGYIAMVKAISQRIRRDYPGVRLVVYCPYSPQYMDVLFEKCGKDFDALSFHPYGWTLDLLFPFLQDVENRYVKATGKHAELIITEWDFWIQGRQKFDYMMRRNYYSVKAQDLAGTIHYRLWQYSEPIYQFGVLQCYDPKTKGQPMHDAYDAFWTWKDFRGERVDAQAALVSKDVNDKLLKHIYADASKGETDLNTVLYYDWAYGGTGYKDYAKGLNYPKVKVNLKLALTPSDKERTLTIGRANGEGFDIPKKDVKIKAGQKEFADTIEIEPLTAYAVTVK